MLYKITKICGIDAINITSNPIFPLPLPFDISINILSFKLFSNP